MIYTYFIIFISLIYANVVDDYFPISWCCVSLLPYCHGTSIASRWCQCPVLHLFQLWEDTAPLLPLAGSGCPTRGTQHNQHGQSMPIMYVCMYVCLSVCLSVCMYVCLYVCMYVGRYTYIYISYIYPIYIYPIFFNYFRSFGAWNCRKFWESRNPPGWPAAAGVCQLSDHVGNQGIDLAAEPWPWRWPWFNAIFRWERRLEKNGNMMGDWEKWWLMMVNDG